MGLFDFLNSKSSGPSFPLRNLVWMDQTAKLNGCIQQILEKPDAVLLAWSTVTQQRFTQHLVTHGLSQRVNLISSTLPSRLEGDLLFMLDHHLYVSDEDSFLEAANPKEVTFFVALDDPIMHLFGSNRIKNVMDRMGMEPGDVMEHAMISKAIKNAQEKCQQQRGSLNIPPEVEDWWRGIH